MSTTIREDDISSTSSSVGDDLENSGQERSIIHNTSFSASGGAANCVTFCGIQLEIVDDHPDIDIHFNRGKSLEDVFEGLTLVSKAPRSDNVQEIMEHKKRVRGQRKAGEVRVETFTNFDGNTISKESSKESTPASATSSSSAIDQMKFSSGNPFVEVTKGVLHLFKENQTTSLEEGIIRSQMLCMLGVPTKIKTPDLLNFTAPCHPRLEMMRIIQDGSPNQYMVLLKFRCQDSADEFYQTFNGQKFNSIEADVCQLVYVSKVETCKESEYYPLGGHTELPVCSICLERMDESVSTLLTILCNHTFHGSCLAQWEDSTCPVCRCVQTPEVVAEQRCSDCQSVEDLWICLICGYVGCGRYVGGHSHAHFLETQHCYTMELGQNRVWDYVGDNFVHRLIQTDSADGKLVETGVGHRVGGAPLGQDGQEKYMDSAEKIDSIQLEYTYMLTSQLEAQRSYYEEKIARIEEQASREMSELELRARSSVEQSQAMEEKMALFSKEKSKCEQKLSQMNQKLTKLSTELKEEREINESLRKNQIEWQEKLKTTEKKLNLLQETKDKEIKELKEQVHDLMMYLEAQSRIEQSPLKKEIQDGDVFVPESSAASTSSASNRQQQKKKKRAK